MLTIIDLPVSRELDTSEKTAVRGGWCVDIGTSVKDGNEDGGVYGAVANLGECLKLIGGGEKIC
jgi:hypothetical protein